MGFIPKKIPKPRLIFSTPIIVYTDGSCEVRSATRNGGWAALINEDGAERVISGGYKDTTSQRMEIIAAMETLLDFEIPTKFIIYSDSQYVVKGITKWSKKWKRNNWHKNRAQEIKNRDLWELFYDLNEFHVVEWNWVKAHSGVRGNEIADDHANKAMRKIRYTR